jgi:hypothetical protein
VLRLLGPCQLHCPLNNVFFEEGGLSVQVLSLVKRTEKSNCNDAKESDKANTLLHVFTGINDEPKDE